MIPAYVDALADALSFDPALSRRVRREVEDHLREAVAADPSGDRQEAERRALAAFGDPRVLAAEFAVVSLASRSRKVGLVVILAIAAIFLVMKVRVAWYAAMQWTMSDELRVVGEGVGLVDRYAFWLSVGIGAAGWAYISGRPVPPTLRPAYRRQIRRCLLVCRAATVALFVTVISDGVLTTLRLLGTDPSIAFLIPIATMTIEIACAGVLLFHVRSMSRLSSADAF